MFSDERCAAALADERLLAAMARFEAALAKAGARGGFFPVEFAETIAAVCERAVFDSAKLAREARHSGTLAIPLVKELTAQVAAVSREAVRWLHFGATSQDVLDTAAALCLKEAGATVLELIAALGDAAAELARRYAKTPTVARTLLQPALPVPFGWKAAMWLAPLGRSRQHFRTALTEACVLQLGGAAGTQSAFGGKGSQIARDVAKELGLRDAVTWHSARDGFARLGVEAAILAGLAGKITRDVALLMQPEIGEAAEPGAQGRGGSSSMPHKRNPSLAVLALEAGARAPGLASTLLAELAPEHERGLGQWQSQWFTLRELLSATASALSAASAVLRGLEIDAEAMLRNLERTKGLVYSEAVALRVSRPLAEQLCERAVRDDKTLLDVMRSDSTVKLTEAELAALFRPESAFGGAQAMIERVLAEWTSARESVP